MNRRGFFKGLLAAAGAIFVPKAAANPWRKVMGPDSRDEKVVDTGVYRFAHRGPHIYYNGMELPRSYRRSVSREVDQDGYLRVTIMEQYQLSKGREDLPHPPVQTCMRRVERTINRGLYLDANTVDRKFVDVEVRKT